MRRAGLGWTWALALAAGVAMAEPGGGATAASTATCTPLGPDAARPAADGFDFFCSRLGGRPGFEVRKLADKRAPASWRGPAPASAGGTWISVVPVCFGPRTDWLAFAFDGAQPVFAVRRPARQWNTQGIYPESIAPGHMQIDRNAGIELAADFGRGWPARSASPPATPLRIVVKPRDLAGEQKGASWNIMEGGAEGQVFPADEQTLEGVRALADAAALRLGFLPGAPGGAGEITLTVSRHVMAYGLEAALTPSGGGTPRRLAKIADQESVYDCLLRLFRALLVWPEGAADFARVDPQRVELLGLGGDTLLAAGPGTLAAWDLATGATLWTIPKPDRGIPPRYAFRPAADAAGAVYQLVPSLLPLDLATGKQAAGRGEAMDDEAAPWAFDTEAGGALVLASGRAVVLLEGRKPAWTNQAADTVGCGPAFVGDGIVAGSDDGRLAMLARAGGAVRWRFEAGERLRGRPVVEDGLILASSLEGTLFAVAAADGALAWRAALGDALLVPPARAGDRVLAATRAGRILALDLKSGALRAERSLPGWLVGFAAVPGSGAAVAIGREGRATLLAADDLAVRRELQLGARMAEGLVAGADIPLRVGPGEELSEKGPAALAVDDEGYLYAIAAGKAGAP